MNIFTRSEMIVNAGFKANTLKKLNVKFILVLVIFSFFSRFASAQFLSSAPTLTSTPTDATFGSYGNSTPWFMGWDNTYLYIGKTGGAAGEACFVYLDIDPLSPANGGVSGGTNSNGNLTTTTDYGVTGTLPFRADIRLVITPTYLGYSTRNGSGGWNTEVDISSGNVGTSGSPTRTIRFPWTTGSLLPGRPTAFNWVGFCAYSTGIYDVRPATGNPSGNAASPRFYFYQTVVNTTNSGTTNPFSSNYQSFETRATFGYNNTQPTTLYDYTVNGGSTTTTLSTGITVRRNLVVNNGDFRTSGAQTLTMSGADGTGTLQINNTNGGTVTGTDAGSGNDLTLTVSGGIITLDGNATTTSDADKKFITVNVNSGATLGLSRGLFCRYGTFTVNGTLQINANGYMNSGSAAATYGASGTLVYNNGGNYTASSIEWPTTNVPNVTIQNSGTNVTLNSNKTVNSTLTVRAGTTLALSTFNIGSPSSVVVETGATGSTISGSSGTLTLGGNITVNSGFGANGATISCPVALGTNRTITVADDTNAATDLTVSGVISGAFTLDKAGAGKMVASGTNTYTGQTNVTAGILNVQNAQGTGTTAGGVVVSSGAAIELQGGITVGAETLTINNTGISSGGSLRNISGNNTWGGAITLSTNATRINSDAGTLTLSNAASIASTNIALTLGGAGNIAISGTTNIGTGTITKDGNGTATLSGASTYTGATTISAGTLQLGAAGSGSNTPLGTTGGATTVNSGGVLDLNGYSLATQEALTINGTGISSVGAFINSTGSATWSGTLTLGSDVSVGGGGDLTIGTSAVTSNQITNSGGFIFTKVGIGNLTIAFSDNTASFNTGSWVIAQGALTTSSSVRLGSRSFSLGTATTSGKFNWTGVGGTLSSSLTSVAAGGGTIENQSTSSPTISSNITLNGNLTFTSTAASGSGLTLSGVISGTGGIIVNSTLSTAALILTNSANTYTGNTTITSGELRLNPSANATFASKIVLNGGRLGTTGITATRTFTSSSTLLVQENSTIALAASTSHSITFASSALESWTGSKTITVSNWATTAGNAGTAGRIFFTNNTGLGQTQLDAFTFSGYANTGAEFVSSGSSGEITPVNSTTITSNASGFWNSAGTWVGGIVPTSFDNVVIASTHEVTVTASASCKKVSFTGTGGVLSVDAGQQLSVSSSVEVEQSASQNNAGTISGGGTLTCATVGIGTTSATSAAATRTATLTSSINALTCSGTITLTARKSTSNINPTFNIQSGTVTATDITTVHPVVSPVTVATVSLLSGAQTGTLRLTGTTPFTLDTDGTNTITLNGTSATVEYSRSGAQPIRAAAYTNLTLSGTGTNTKTPDGAYSVSGTLSLQGTATLASTAPTYGSTSTLEYKNVGTRTTNAIEWPASSGPANLIVDNSGSTVTMLGSANRSLTGNLTLTAGTLADAGNILSVGGNIAGTATHTGAGSITMTGTTKTISGATLQNLTLNGSGFSLTGSPTINGALTFTAGRLSIGSNTLNLAGTVASMSITNNITGSASSNLNITGTGALGTLFLDATAGGTTNRIADFTLNRTSSGTATLGSAITISGNLTLINGTLTTGANTLTYSGSSISRTNGNIDASNASAVVAFTNTGSSLSLPASLFSGTVSTFTVNGSGGVTLGGNTTMGTLNLTSGTLTVGSANTVTINTLVAQTSGALASGTDAGTFSFAGTGSVTGTVAFNNVTINGALTPSTGTTINGTLQVNSGSSIATRSPLFGSSSTLQYNHGGNFASRRTQALEWPSTSGPANLTLTNGSWIQLAGARSLTGNVTITSGGLQSTGGNTLTMAGSTQTFTVSTTSGGGVYGTDNEFGNDLTLAIASGSTTTFTGDATTTDDDEKKFVSVNVNSGGTLILQRGILVKYGTFTVDGTLQINSNGYVRGNGTMSGGSTADIKLPTYGSSSTLIYNSGGTYTAGFEWTANAASGVGVPRNVTIGNGVNTTLSFGSSGSYRRANGNVTISASSGLTLSSASGGDLYVGSNFTNNGTFTPSSRMVEFLGGAAQTITGSFGTEGSSNNFAILKISNTSGGVSLAASTPVIVTNTLNLNSGNLTTGSNTLTVTNTATNAVTGGSTTTFVNGPLRRTLAPNLTGASNVFSFPVGSGSTYLPFTLNNPTTGATGPVLQVTANSGSAGGSIDNPNVLSSISTSEYWQLNVVSGNFSNGGADITRQSALGSLNVIGRSTAQSGAYASIGGSASGTTINGTANAIGAISLGNSNFFVMSTLLSPSIASLSAASGYSGQSITINGTSFASNATVSINSVSATITAQSSTSITATIANTGAAVSGTTVVVNNPTASSSASSAFNFLGHITAGTGDWNTTGTWAGNALPTAGATVTIDHAVTVDGTVTNAPSSVTINSTKSLTFVASGALTATTVTNNGSVVMTAGGTLTIAASGTLTNNSTFTRGAGTVNFAGAATVDGSAAITFNNFTINTGAVTLTTIPTIDGTLRINGGFVSAAPRYSANSTLLYNSNYNRSTEWSASGIGTIGSTVGYPNNVTINSGFYTLLNGDATTNRAINGSLTIASGATFATGAKEDAVLYIGGNISNSGTLTIAAKINTAPITQVVVVTGNVTNSGTLSMGDANGRLRCANFTNSSGTVTLSTVGGGDLEITGSLVDNATFNSNNRAVFFTGTGTQDVSGSGTFNIDYIVSDKASGSIRMLCNLLVEGPNGGNAITLTNTTDTLNLNDFTLTLGKGSVGSGITGSGFIKGSSSSSLTILGTGALGTVRFDQTTPGTTNVLNNLTINRTSTGTVTLGNALKVTGILTLTNGTFTVGTNTLTYSGSSIARTSGTIDASTGSTITFTNTDPLTLPASVFSGNVNNLTMNGTGGVTLGSATTVAGTLTLTSGILTTTSTNKLTINSSATGAISGGSTSSYVNGPLDRTLANATSYTYPIGGSSFYRPVTLQSVVAPGNPVVRATFASTGATTGNNTTIKTTLFSARNWRIEEITTALFTSATLAITETDMTNGTHVIAKSNNNQAGTYVSVGTPQTVASGAITSPAGQGVGYYAIGEIQTYTVTYDENTGSGSQTDATDYEYNATVTVKNAGTMTKTGYTFAGWNTAANGSGTARAVSSTFSVTSNVTLYAQWTINSYTLTYNGNTNTGGSAPTAVTQNYNTSVAISDSGSLAKTGYSFAGWNTAANGSGTPYLVAENFTFTSDVTIYAQWTINSYSVTYDGNSATGGTEPSSTNHNYNSTVTVSANSGTLVRTGYTFGGWNTAEDGTGTNYTAGTGTFTMGAGNVILYAKWNINSYTITYNGNGNSSGSAPASANYNYNASVTVSGPGSLAKTGNTFAGWNTAANGSGSSYGTGDNFNMPANNITLYAQWSTGSYTLNYSGNSNSTGTAPAGGTYSFGSSQTVSANTGNLARTGYTFAGWNTESDGSGTDYAATGSASFIIPAENTTLFAKWTINQYTFAYNGNGNTGGDIPQLSTNYNYNTEITAASNSGSLTKTGYTFAGWNTAANGSGTTYTAGETFNLGAADVTLYAKWTAIPYNVFYDDNGATSGSQSDATNYIYNQTVTVKNQSTIVKTGYTFAGWNTAANGSGTTYTANQTFAIGTSDVTLYAQWTINTYTLSYDNNGGTGSQSDGSSPYNYNSTVTVKSAGSMIRTGYTFAGWNTAANGSGTSREAGETFSIASDVTLYAQWTINTYTVTYNNNGGTGSQPDASSPYNYNSTVTVKDSGTIARIGYTFAGWNTAANGTGSTYNATETFVISSNVTLYAKWTINSYSVTYDGNGATGGTEPSTTNHNYNTNVTVSSNSGSLVRAGYTFLGWNTQANGGGTNLPAGTGSFTMDASNVILYAEWSINSYRITYNGNGSTGGSAPNQADYDYNTTVTVSGPNTLAKTGNTFAGWNTAANGSGNNYGTGDNFNMPANNITLYAQWSTGSYTLNYSGNLNSTGTAPAGGTYSFGSSQTVSANTGNLARTGYTFSGWNTEADGSGNNYAATGSASFTIPAENTTLFAKWVINSYTVTYNANGGSGSQSDSDSPYDYDSTVTVKNAGTVARVGYIFNGWNTAADGSGTSYNPGETFNMGTANVILYAKWTAINYNVTYDENTGTGSQSDATNYTYNQTVTVKNAGTIAKTGYTFAGWNTAQNGSGTSRAVASTFSITSDVTLYAQWTINTFTVTYNANGGSGSQSDASSPYNYNTTVTVKNEGTIAKAGSEFAGWNTAADGSGTSRAVASTFPITSNVTLYAQWTTNDYTITFNGNGSDGGSMSVQSITFGTSANLTTNSFTRTSYVFTGWATSSGGSVAYANQASYTMSTASNVTLYAKWEDIGLASFRTRASSANFSSGSGWEYNNGNGWVQAVQPPVSTNNITISHPTTIDDDFTVGSGKTFTVAAGSLTINPGITFTVAGTANFGGLPVTLKSTAAGTAAIGQITGTLNGATSVTVERYIGSGRRAWRLLTIPVTGPTIRQAWAGANANANAPTGESAGSGTLITGHGATYPNGTAAAAAGFDWFSGLSNVATSSIRFYENDNWYSATNTPTTTAAPDKQGYMLFVRGDRTVTFFGNANTTLRPTGTLKTGDRTVTVSNPFEVVGNPYASAIDLNSMYLNSGNSAKIERNFWIWDATMGTFGGYRSIGWDGSSSYDMTGGPGSPLDYLKVQSGQAFFVEKSGGGSITIKESNKVSSNGYALRTYPTGGLTGAITKINVNLHDGAAGSLLLDGVKVRLNDYYDKASDETFDVAKLNAFAENLSILRDNRYLSIESRPIPTTTDTVYFSFWNLGVRSYTLRINTTDWDAKIESAVLIDRLTKKSTPIDMSGATTDYNFSIDNAGMGISSDRFILVFKNAVTLPVRFTKVAAQKKADGIAVSWQTANVSGVKDFDVERSADGVSFAKVNSVAAVNTSGLRDYAIMDNQPLTGWNYYRIRSNDVSGSYTYSSVVKAQWLGNAQIRVYPNVIANGKINLQLQDQQSGRYQVVLTTVSGQRVYSNVLQHAGGTSSYSLELKGKKRLSGGEYILVVYSNNEIKQTEKVVIQ